MGIVTAPIVSATHDDVDQIADMMSAAFHNAPDVRWLMPDPRRRTVTLGRFSRALLHHCVDVGVADVTAGRTAAAVWFDHDAIDPHAYQEIVETSCGDYAGPVLRLAAFLAEHTPDRPHMYLAFLGVHPAQQREGLGSALLAHRHAVLDPGGRSAYLVATTPGSRDLYLRHGYTVTSDDPVQPDGGPRLWPMWRDPQTSYQHTPSESPKGSEASTQDAHLGMHSA